VLSIFPSNPSCRYSRTHVFWVGPAQLDVTAELKALIDRAGFVARANGDMFKRKVGAAVVAGRRAGSIHVFDSINHFFFIGQMIVPGSIYWNMGFGLQKGEVDEDEEGLLTMRILGQNMAWLLKKLYNTRGSHLRKKAPGLN